MRLLLDTHTLLWFFMGNSQMSDRVRGLFSPTPIAQTQQFYNSPKKSNPKVGCCIA